MGNNAVNAQSSGPRISVITAVYNGERYLRESIDSILAQTFRDFELIVVDDASTDRTAGILASYADRRIRVFRNSQNWGNPGPSRSAAIRLATGQYIAIQDADDVSLPNRLQRQLAFMEDNADISLSGSYVMTVDGCGKETGIWKYPLDDVDIKWALLSGNPFAHSSVMLRRAVLQQTGLYSNDPEICAGFVEDFELFCRVNRVAKSANLAEVLVKYRMHPQNATSMFREKQSEQTTRIVNQNVAWLIGWEEVPDSAIKGSREFSSNWTALTADEARWGVALNRAIHERFAARYLTPAAGRRRCRQFYFQCARRSLAQARQNPHLDRRCRIAMLGNTAKLLLAACKPVAPSGSANHKGSYARRA